jgi:hypothetical protein
MQLHNKQIVKDGLAAGHLFFALKVYSPILSGRFYQKLKTMDVKRISKM